MFNKFQDEFGTGESVIGDMAKVGPRNRFVGMTSIQLLANCVDPRTKDLTTIPEGERLAVWGLFEVDACSVLYALC
jgi:hypothetical protein